MPFRQKCVQKPFVLRQVHYNADSAPQEPNESFFMLQSNKKKPFCVIAMEKLRTSAVNFLIVIRLTKCTLQHSYPKLPNDTL